MSKNLTSINLDGFIYEVEKVGQKFWIKQNEQIWCYDIADLSEGRQTRKKSKSTSPDKILSPMPGKVTKVFIQKGDSVKVGQALVVLEAMKMEYTLKSEIDSHVEDVFVKINDQVQVGHFLVKLSAGS